MNSINDFPWNRTEITKKQYNEPNCKIINTSGRGEKALIFFSSNGIYFPNTEKEFREKMIDLDYYDWLNIGKHRLVRRYFSKIVFVRDIYKQWYVTGINSKVDSQYKLYEFLRDELKGYDITTCGSSSGGYIAALMGCLLGAERIIDSSGQFTLKSIIETEPFLKLKADDPEFGKYCELKDIISGHTDSLYYFYPARNEGDIRQNDYIKDISVKRFAMNSDRHSRTIRPVCFPYVLTMPGEKLDFLQEKYSGKVVDETELYIEIVPKINRIIDPAVYNITRVFSYLLKKVKG